MSVSEKAAGRSGAGQRRPLAILRVLHTGRVTPQMLRITFGGEELGHVRHGPNIKLQVPPPGMARPQWAGLDPDGRTPWPVSHPAPVSRTYTIRRLDHAAGELEIDFVLHGDDGPAAAWAARAQPGDELGISAAGGVSIGQADWYCIAGDHTALPAIAVILENLPETARGHAFVEVPDAAEQQPVVNRSQVQLHWLHSGAKCSGTTGQLEQAVRALEWPQQDSEVFVWVGAESGAARAIRQHVRGERGLDRRKALVIGYWKQGFSENEYKERHDNDRDQDYYAIAREAWLREHGRPHPSMTRFATAMRGLRQWWVRHFVRQPGRVAQTEPQGQ